jgi:hypothetical protein
MIITYDIQANILAINHTGNHSWGTDVVAALNRHGQTVSLKSVSFGITVKADSETVLDQSWPPEGVRFSKTNQDTLATSRVNWKPDQTISVYSWFINTLGQKLTATDRFVAPRPAQPYPSWTWDNGWQPPIQYPEEGDWQWNEDNQQWSPYENRTNTQ